MLDCLQMGCLPSRSSTVSPADSIQTSKDRANGKKRNGQQHDGYNSGTNDNLDYDSRNKQLVDIGTSFDNEGDSKLPNMSDHMNQGPEDDIMSILLDDQEKRAIENIEKNVDKQGTNGSFNNNRALSGGQTFDENDAYSPSPKEEGGLEREGSQGRSPNYEGTVAVIDDGRKKAGKSNENSFDEDLNLDILRQYISVDFEITQLEDRDALRIYHEKIEQLEQLERELDMISSEAEEVAARSEMDLSQSGRFSTANGGTMNQNDSKVDMETNSLLSGITNSTSPKSSIRMNRSSTKQTQQQQQPKNARNQIVAYNNSSRQASTRASSKGRHNQERSMDIVQSNDHISTAYSTIEEVFDRKIILEKQRDKLKKEVEQIIIECDKLQQKYKKRDDILDKLFDGRTGNGLENHLEQQLNWLMEQKHYVDQVFYAWKRAETLTSQTCEQFASALELLKRLPKLQDDDQRMVLAKSIEELLVKSRHDMDQAQRYNPNVDAPFFTDTETDRFDKIIKAISKPQSITQSEYSQIATVIQFAYKRAVSIRLWLEQILQITIARDSFELAEEYKWIAIQLRKERITLINSKLQEPPYRAMSQSIREQMALQQHQQQINDKPMTANMIMGPSGKKNEVNRDSGVESDDIEIEEEIYKLLEMNKSRIEASVAMQYNNQTADKASNNNLKTSAQSTNSIKRQRDELIRERIQSRVRGERPLALNSQKPPGVKGDEQDSVHSSTTTDLSTPSKLRLKIDETSKKSLLKQVDQMHANHRSKMENLRGSTKARATNFISSRVQNDQVQSTNVKK